MLPSWVISIDSSALMLELETTPMLEAKQPFLPQMTAGFREAALTTTTIDNRKDKFALAIESAEAIDLLLAYYLLFIG